MLIRKKDMLDWFEISEVNREKLIKLAKETANLAEGMTHFNDYLALGAVALSTQPKKIFEIGTYLGVTSNFLLKLLPKMNLVSIAFINPPKFLPKKRFNNSELSKSQVGSAVETPFRSRFIQLFGNSHDLSSEAIIKQFGYFDMAFIDGDHSRKGVELDTKFVESILVPEGTICWHDANPKPRYLEVRDFLENMTKIAFATEDNYTGGIAIWSEAIENKISNISSY